MVEESRSPSTERDMVVYDLASFSESDFSSAASIWGVMWPGVRLEAFVKNVDGRLEESGGDFMAGSCLVGTCDLDAAGTGVSS